MLFVQVQVKQDVIIAGVQLEQAIWVVQHMNAAHGVADLEYAECPVLLKVQHFVQEQHGTGHHKHHLQEIFSVQQETHVQVIAVVVDNKDMLIGQAAVAEQLQVITAIAVVVRQEPEV